MLLHTLAAGLITTTNLPNPSNVSLAPILKIVFSIAGSVCLLMVAIGGLRYILAHGEPSDVAQAKNTIIYAIVGLVVVLLAYAIVNFVVLKVTK